MAELESPVASESDVSIPAGLTQTWPVPRQEVYGPRDGIGARIEYVALRATLGFLAVLPAPLERLCIAWLAHLARAFDRKRSAAARVFLRQALGQDLEPRELERRVLDSWKHILRVAIEGEGFDRNVPSASILDHYRVETTPEFDALVKARRSAIVITGHIGDWEAGSALLPWLGFDPVYVVAKPPRNRPLSIHIQRLREQRGIRCLARRGAMRDAGNVIRAGGTLALLLDQRARSKPVMAPFFGRLARCDRSAGVLIKRLGVPLVFAACYQEPRAYRYHLVFTRVLEPHEFSASTPEEIAAVVNSELERLILVHPEQYFWLHDRYRDAPSVASAPGAASAPGGASAETP
jgi:KDO2-lipid IV(A) lauroyltransferase